jgi:hypothetical protein
VKKYRYKEVFSPTISLNIVVSEDDLLRTLSSESDPPEKKFEAMNKYLDLKDAKPFFETSLSDFQEQLRQVLEANPEFVARHAHLPIDEEFAKSIIRDCFFSIGFLAYSFNLSLSEIADSAVNQIPHFKP